MSRNYDNWEKLVEAVLRREKDRQLALFESFSSSVFSSRPSFDSDAAPSSQSNFVSDIQFEEIKLSAQNFHPDMLLGEGRFGPVFKGWIHEHFLTAVKPGSGIAVAIRKLKKRGTFDFDQPRHPNLVKLIGYSFDEGNRILVHEFMPNGSLDNHLFLRGHQTLSWETRVKVATGAARGLSLYYDLKISVTHEGVKSSSILLDDEFNASWSDFHLTAAPILTEMSYRVSNDYAAPEYIAAGMLTVKSDVYSFGIILLELLCGLRVFDQNRPMKEQNLVVWMKPYLSKERKLLQIVDSRLGDLYPHDKACKFGKLALECLSLDPKLRPSMTEVVDTLEQFGAHCHPNRIELPTGTDRLMDPASWTNGLVLRPDPSSLSLWVLQEVMAIQFDVIKKATRNFRPDLLLGEGRSGPVYKGIIYEHPLTGVKLEPGIIVAVKKLNLEGLPEQKEWFDEINHLSQLRHSNLVRIIGYSFNKDDRIVVSEYMARGSLNNYLFRRGHQSLPWATRIRVAVGAARAFAYLHGLEIPVVHRSIKSGDILLDGDFNPKLSHVAIATDGPTGSNTHVSTRVTPEYMATGHLTTRCDVYGFGVILLELVTGLRAHDLERPTGQHYLLDWAIPYFRDKRRLSRIMDSRLEGQYPRREAYKVGKLALKCVNQDPRLRPNMSDVVVALEKL